MGKPSAPAQHPSNARQQQSALTTARFGMAAKDASPSPADAADPIHGEGNYAAAREYDAAAKAFAESGRVEQAARDAAPRSEQERREMEQAEAVGRDRAKDGKPAQSGRKPG